MVYSHLKSMYSYHLICFLKDVYLLVFSIATWCIFKSNVLHFTGRVWRALLLIALTVYLMYFLSIFFLCGLILYVDSEEWLALLCITIKGLDGVSKLISKLWP